MKPFLFILLSCLVFSSGCALRGIPDSGEAEPIRYVFPGGANADEEDILRLAKEADYILIGEQHDNPTDHKAQAQLLDLLARKGEGRILLGLEMLPRRYYDFQLDAFRKGSVTLAGLPEALNWKNTWGYDFALYSPVFETVQARHIPTYGLNLPDTVRRAVSRKGLARLTSAEKAELPKRILPPLPEQKERLAAVFRMHGRMRGNAAMPDKKPLLERFLLVQSLWDSTMAEQAVSRLRSALRDTSAKVLPRMLILAGAGHVEYGHGIASRIKALDPKARLLLVMPFSGPAPDPEAADLFYYSEPRSHSPSGISVALRRGKVLVINVAPGSPAEAADLKAGDILLKAGGSTVRSPMDLHTAAAVAKRQNQPLRFQVERAGRSVQVSL